MANPKQIASIKNLLRVWRNSKDAVKYSRKSAGVDGVTPQSFSADLSENIASINSRLVNSLYSFAKLRPFFIDKSGGKMRVICAPTVEDRLVQRLILDYLTTDKEGRPRDLLGVNTSVSYGIKRGKDQGTQEAIKKAIKYRNESSWVLKTDISSFFDKIPREYLKQQVRTRLGQRSVVPLLNAVIDCEVKSSNDKEAAALRDCGLVNGIGLRQGMPLSPLLSNVVLNKFDKKIVSKGLKCVRYVDDLIFFCDSREECFEIEKFVNEELKKIKLEIPSLKAESKTQIKSPDESIEFLGVEIYKTPNAGYAHKIPKETIRKALERLSVYRSLDFCDQEGLTYVEVSKHLNDVKQGYFAAYKDCTNFEDFYKKMTATINQIRENLMIETLGRDYYNSLSPKRRRFLGFLVE